MLLLSDRFASVESKTVLVPRSVSALDRVAVLLHKGLVVLDRQASEHAVQVFSGKQGSGGGHFLDKLDISAFMLALQATHKGHAGLDLLLQLCLQTIHARLRPLQVDVGVGSAPSLPRTRGCVFQRPANRRRRRQEMEGHLAGI